MKIRLGSEAQITAKFAVPSTCYWNYDDDEEEEEEEEEDENLNDIQ